MTQKRKAGVGGKKRHLEQPEESQSGAETVVNTDGESVLPY